ncbi:MAG: hypothetical protein GTO60_14935 [Gammaproteobacteria bacterium]|nr:hypothetical protein [Gammaproteobacteria bacterium]NIO61377.1 hypothetical protein [Gammaproteobacteria bacterium]
MKRLFKEYPGNLFESGNFHGLAEKIVTQMKDPVVPSLTVPTWADKGQQLNDMIGQVVKPLNK